MCVALACLVAAGGAIRAEETTGWRDTAELSFVAVSGNSEASSLGFKNTLVREWTRSSFTFNAAGVRVETTDTDPVAIGADPGYVVDRRENKRTTAEYLLLHTRYDQKYTERMFWFAGAGWDRNRFAGIENRAVVEGGVGHIWVDREAMKFRTAYALTYTDQEDTSGVDDSFVGARVSADYFNQLGAHAGYTSQLTLDSDLEESSNFRADWTNALSVALSKRLALKVSLQWLYDNEPALREIPLENPLGTPTGNTVFIEFDELDTVFTTSLVVNF